MTHTEKQQAKFTPGEWKVVGATQVGKFGKDWACIADAVIPRSPNQGKRRGHLLEKAEPWHERFEEACANAHLISAAPELYAFVQKQFDEMNCICKGAIGRTQALMGTNVPCTKCEAETLLAKARGQK